MKIIIVAMVLFQLSASAQSVDIGKYGPKRFINCVEILAGPSINFPNDHGFGEFIKNAPSASPATDEFKPKVGYSIGLGLAHSISKRFELPARVLLERKGYKEVATVDGGPDNFYKFTNDTRIDYLTISILPRYYLGRNQQFHLFTGGYYSRLLGSFREEYSYLNGQVTQVTSTTNNPIIYKYEGGVCFGAGYSLRLGSVKRLTIQVQGSYGLNDIVKVNKLRITGSSILVSVAYKIYGSQNLTNEKSL